MNKLKLLFTLLMGMLIVFAAQRAYFVKSDMLNKIYSDIIFTRLAVETQQYTRQIEYGLENGKSLENFYNMQLILSDVKRCSSYINGAHIISENYRLMYSFGDDENIATPSVVRIPDKGSVFSVCEDNSNRYLLSVAINGRDDIIAGYLILNINHNITDNAIAEFDHENLIQVAVVCLLAFLAGAVAMIHLCRTEKYIVKNGTKVISITVCAGEAIDMTISLFKFWMTIDSLIQQSVTKITMTLQNDLDTVIEKGVSIGRIYDLNSWLLENCRQVPFIDNLIYDKNYKISAMVSADYAKEQMVRYGAILARIVGVCILAGILIILSGYFADTLKNKRKNKGEPYVDVEQ